MYYMKNTWKIFNITNVKQFLNKYCNKKTKYLKQKIWINSKSTKN